jgi:glutathione S-transferase
MDRLTLYGSFTSSSSYKPMLYLALAQLPFSFRTVNLKTGVQKTPEYLSVNRWGVVPSLRHRGLTILQSRGAGFPRKVRFALDSPLEGQGFEPSVPRMRDPTSIRSANGSA